MHLAYLAGIIDGEGSIMLPATGRATLDGMPTSFCLRLIVSNTDMRLLSAIQAVYGGAIEATSTATQIAEARCKPGYRLVWRSVTAVALIGKTLPFLIVKREQAQMALAFHDMREGLGLHKRRTREQVVEFNRIAQHIKALNRRGVRPATLLGA